MSTTLSPSLLGCALATLTAAAAWAEAPRVAADIAPVHGLVARVMEGVGTPELVGQPGGSPHHYAMRPSEARALEQADAVFWIGRQLTPWLEGAVDSLASDAVTVKLLEVPGSVSLEFRQGATFEAHDHAHEDEGHGSAGHDHGADGHDAEGSDHAEHEHDHDEHEEHAHDDHAHNANETDPHAWLDPENAKLWLDVIAGELSALDPPNATRYRENAAAGRAEIDAAVADARQALAPAEGLRFVVFHDAYHYFESRFGLAAAGAISLSDASDPSPARLEAVRDAVRELGVECVFSEPQFDQRLVRTVLDGTEGRAGIIDPLGFEIETGPGFYPALIRTIAGQIADCAQ
jgi:zinc transport system substrate-binding protein